MKWHIYSFLITLFVKCSFSHPPMTSFPGIVRPLDTPSVVAEKIIESPPLFLRRKGETKCFVKKQYMIPAIYRLQNGVSELIKSCCQGFQPSPYNSSVCEPICSISCQNGYCVAPEICECFPGYIRTEGGFCIPTCPIACENGHCLSGKICQCKNGYSLHPSGKFCQAHCKSKCDQFSYCTLSGACDCIKGYQRNYKGKCVPVCNPSCGKGICIRPNVCFCTAFSVLVGRTCVRPNCPNGCINGRCVADNICSCYAGFTLTTKNRCDPVCRSGCSNGYCSARDKCSCKPGYTMIKQQCKPICKERCINGKCTSPETCTCNKGYLPVSKSQCEPYCRYGCPNGYCSAPDTCTCPNGYQFLWGKCRKPVWVGRLLQENALLASSSRTIISCSKNCLNGFCIGNNLCKCNSGYTLSSNNPFVCIATCPRGCINGVCSKPHLCLCRHGFRKINENICARK